ncbi:matrixin family metalloprotease [Candidatus Woesearchaeota archaeon]|nr:matrixin family metalloprotease [Candidatus Woesearchaeota archaeon]
MKRIISILIIAVLMLSMTATASMIDLPDKASDKTDKSPVIEDGNLYPPGLEKIEFIHYKKGYGKPGTSCGNGICEAGENANKCPADCGSGEEPPVDTGCYTPLAKGVFWKTLPVDLYINPTNANGLSEDFIVTTTIASAEAWDDATSAELTNNYIVDYTADYDDTATDGRNEISFGDYAEPGVIGVTIIWGYFSGPPRSRRIVETDVMLDDVDFVWGDATIDPSVMDVQNIMTHELGHAYGLGDLYESACAEVTMYGYSTEGELKKRTLEPDDVVGIQELYG